LNKSRKIKLENARLWALFDCERFSTSNISILKTIFLIYKFGFYFLQIEGRIGAIDKTKRSNNYWEKRHHSFVWKFRLQETAVQNQSKWGLSHKRKVNTSFQVIFSIDINSIFLRCFDSKSYVLVKFDVPRTEISQILTEMSKDKDYLRSGVSPLVDLEEFQVKCLCEEKGEFVKNPFKFESPMTSWDKKRVYKNYGLRL